MGRVPLGAFLVIAPLAVGAALFQSLIPFTHDIERLFSDVATQQAARYPAGFLNLSAAIVAQSIIAFGVAVYSANVIAATPVASRVVFLIFSILLAVALFGFFVVTIDSEAMKVSYGIYRDFYERALPAQEWTTPREWIFGLSQLEFMVIFPGALAAFAVGFTTLAAHAQIAAQKDSSIYGYGSGSEFARERMRLCLYLLAAVLAVSIVVLSMFFQLPADIAKMDQGADPATVAAMESFIGELTLFWAVVFTCMNVIAIGLPFFTLHFRSFYRPRNGEMVGAAQIFSFSDFSGGVDFRSLVERLLLMISPAFFGKLSTVLGNLG